MENILGVDSEDELAASLSQLRAWQGHGERPSCSHHDPYADSSIDFGAQPAYPMDQTEAKMLVMKRKVLRHRPDGRVEVFDESANAKPRSLGHRSAYVDDGIPEEEIGTSSGTLQNYLHCDDDPEDRPYSLRGDYESDTISEYPIPGLVPMNYIAPKAVRQKRTDPVAKLNGYKQDWERFSIPGQDTHQGLRWAVRMQMQQSGLPRRAQKRLVPNMYEVPTTKKRDSLRFSVRWYLAHGLMPRHNSSS
ncbi:centriolar and ciliogenesis-associated protein HYLS1 [Chamaea fasciata]|uniref:centriolar and ciliogenesis-associated protein HYLS1 n=1 Tax=Chamaea fasciata TaxID=190680 RepID=UPI00336ABD80